MKLTLSNSDESGRALDPLSGSASNLLARNALVFAAGAMFYWALATLVPYFSGVNIIRLTPFFVAAAGYFLGFYAGAIASLAAIVIHTRVFNGLGYEGAFAVFQTSPAVHVGILLLGPMAGRMRAINRRLQSEIARGKNNEDEMREAQRRFRQLADAVEDVLWSCSADRTRVDYLSPAFEGVFGIPRTRIEDNPRSLLKFVHPDDRKSVTQMFDSSPESVSQLDFRIIRPDGATRWIRSRTLCVRDASSAAPRVAGVWSDVTDNTSNSRTLRISQAKYNDLVEKIPAVVYVAPLDPSKPLFYVSPQIEFILGYPQDVWLSDAGGFNRSYHPDDADAVAGRFRECIEQNKRFVADYRMIARNGSVRWFHEEADVVLDQSGEPLFVQGVLRDVTGQRYDELSERGRGRVLAKLACGASLPDILTTLSESMEELIPDSYCSIAMLDRETDRMYCGAFSGLPPAVARLIDGAQPGPEGDCVGRAIHSGERVVIADVSEGALGADQAQRMLESELRGCWVQPIRSSGGDMLGALAVYLHKVTEPEARHLDLLTSAAGLAGIAIEFRQTEADLRRSEERYRKLSQTSDQERRKPPAAKTGRAETAETLFPPFTSEVRREMVVAAPRTGPETVLVAGGEPAVQESIREVARKLGYRALMAADGPAARAMAAESGAIDLLITEMALPRGDGRELADQLRYGNPRLKVLFLAGYFGSASVRTTELGPGTSFLPKPFSSEALSRKIRVLMDTPPPQSPGSETGPKTPDHPSL